MLQQFSVCTILGDNLGLILGAIAGQVAIAYNTSSTGNPMLLTSVGFRTHMHTPKHLHITKIRKINLYKKPSIAKIVISVLAR